MIQSIHLTNFKCFENHTINFMSTSIIVGKNNAGKSTLIEALRIIAVITERAKGLKLAMIKEALVPSRKALKLSIRGLDINFINVFHDYGEPPAIIEAIFDNNIKLSVYIIDEKKIYAFYSDTDGRIFEQNQIKYNLIPKVGILPQIAPLAFHEEELESTYVKRNISTKISFMHFRNQLKVYKQYYQEFKNIVEKSWQSIEVKRLDSGTGLNGNELSLIIRENGFAAEVSWMGHGIQMWLQTMWFIARTKGFDTVILDEPDVYMHADLQKKLVRILLNKYPQIIIATHSIEIIQEVPYQDIIILDRRNGVSCSARNNNSVQKLVERLGTINNIQMTRLWYNKKCIFFEGDDLLYLKILHDKYTENHELSLDLIPNMSIGGWGGWNYVIGNAMFLKTATNENIKIYCLFDSDYHTQNEIDERKKEAINKNINIHIWIKKEIENYLINCAVIKRIIDKENSINIDISEIEKLVMDIVIGEKDKLIDKVMDSLFKEKRSYEPSRIRSDAKQIVEKYAVDGILIDRISGKQLISLINIKCKERYNVSFSAQRLAYEFTKDDIPNEVINFFKEMGI